MTWVYPRACGGTFGRVFAAYRLKGLSPRLRGNGRDRDSSHEGQGSIPALAGERSGRRKLHWHARVYPRACGGTSIEYPTLSCRLGLSPRLRGNASSRKKLPILSGSIPALAGERESPRFVFSRGKVYPRACGGTSRATCGNGRGEGLSPRLRGNALLTPSPSISAGSIPALAGERQMVRHLRMQIGVYPRACGGTVPGCRMLLFAAGLSPRLRGNGMQIGLRTPSKGSIPALAGERPGHIRTGYGYRVYPRACGGTMRCPGATCVATGLSPRLRGNVGCCRYFSIGCGSIPALAGERLDRG